MFYKYSQYENTHQAGVVTTRRRRVAPLSGSLGCHSVEGSEEVNLVPSRSLCVGTKMLVRKWQLCKWTGALC